MTHFPHPAPEQITVRYSTGGFSEDEARGFADIGDAIRFARYEHEQSDGFGWADVYAGAEHVWRFG